MNTWRVEDFVTYLYHVVADADMNSDEREIASNRIKIEAILKTYFQGIEYNYDESMKVIKNTPKIYNLEVKDVITVLLKKFQFTNDFKTDLFSDLNDLVSSDDRVTTEEYEIVNKIKVLLKNA